MIGLAVAIARVGTIGLTAGDEWMGENLQNSTRPMLMGYAQRARHYTWPASARKCEKCMLSVVFRRLFEYSAEGKEAVASA